MFYKKTFRFIETVEEMNKIIEQAEEWREGIFPKLEAGDLPVNSFVLTKTQFRLYTAKDWTDKDAGYFKPFQQIVYCFDLTGRDRIQKVDGGTVFGVMQHEYKVPDLRDDPVIKAALYYVPEWDNFFFGVEPILGYNPKYTDQEIYSYEYDLNSAYAAALIQPIPDTTSYRLHSIVGENEVGFSVNDLGHIEVVEPGNNATFVFALMPSPYIDFVSRWYERKANAANKDEKTKAKNYLTYGIGYLQKRNPFIRAMVIWRCNKIIEDLIDDDAILWNTDAIYSTKPISTLTLGTGLGEWKLENQGPIRYKGLEYQVVGEKPHYRGIPRDWFPDNFNLLTDKLPERGNKYYYDKEKHKIVETEKHWN